MIRLSIGELAELTDGQLTMGDMPPRGGPWEPLQRIDTNPMAIQRGDVFWNCSRFGQANTGVDQFVFSRGALGVVSTNPGFPWDGRFSLQVDDARSALLRAARRNRCTFPGTVIAVVRDSNSCLTKSLIHAVLSTELLGTLCEYRQTWQTWQIAFQMLELAGHERYAIADLSHAPRSENCSTENRISILCDPDIVVINGNHNSTPGAMTNDLGVDRWISSISATCTIVLINGNRAEQQHFQALIPNVLTVGGNPEADLRVSHVTNQRNSLSFCLDGMTFVVPANKERILEPALAACVVGKLLHLTTHSIASALARLAVSQFHGERPTDNDLAFAA